MNEAEKISVHLIQQHFGLPATSAEGNDNLHAIREALIDKIDFLLSHDFEKLLWMLYRIDVSESKAKAMLIQQSEKIVVNAIRMVC